MARTAKKKKAVSKKAKPTKKPAKPIKKAKTVKVIKKAAQPKKATKSVSIVKSKVLAIGSSVPDFDMRATIIGQVSRTSLKGKPFVLYFYPKDDTSGCTAEACEFRNNLSIFNKVNAAIIGVSKDSIESHEKFSRKYSLNFPLASDEGSDICERFGTWVQKSMYGRSYMGIERTTFLVDSKGIIRGLWRKVSVSGHVDEVKKALEGL
ncbi:MAG: peroxiredoxin [Alphaproteobacteria bacterium]